MRKRSFARRHRWLTAGVAAAVLATLITGSVIAASAAVPVNTVAPVVTGKTKVGEDLKGSNGTWTGASSYSYRWLRCDAAGNGCVAIAGATKNRYKLTSAELNATIKFEVTAASGADKAVALSKQTVAITVGEKPANTALPTITGAAANGSTLTGTNGTWGGLTPITFTYQWQRCDAKGAACQNIPGANKTTYVVTSFEAGLTLRFKVTAKNRRGNASAVSLQTSVVAGAGGGGGKVIDVREVPVGERLIVNSVTFSPKVIRSRTKPFLVTIVVKDTRNNLVKGAQVFFRSTPLVTTTPAIQETNAKGAVTYSVKPKASFPLKNGYNVQFFVKASRKGDPVLSGVSGSRLVQVATGK